MMADSRVAAFEAWNRMSGRLTPDPSSFIRNPPLARTGLAAPHLNSNSQLELPQRG